MKANSDGLRPSEQHIIPCSPNAANIKCRPRGHWFGGLDGDQAQTSERDVAHIVNTNSIPSAAKAFRLSGFSYVGHCRIQAECVLHQWSMRWQSNSHGFSKIRVVFSFSTLMSSQVGRMGPAAVRHWCWPNWSTRDSPPPPKKKVKN